MKIIDLLLTPNSQRPEGNRPGEPLTPQGVTVHRTGDPGANARAVRNFFDTPRPGRESSAHYIVDPSGDIIRCIPENEVAWHAGTQANHRDIGLETCEPLTPEAYAATVALVIDIHRRNGWNPVLGETIRPHSFYDPINRPEDPFSWNLYQAGSTDPGKLYDPLQFLNDVLAALSGGSSIVATSQGAAESDAATNFTDVPADHWAAGAIRKVAELGLMKGDPGGTFRPDQPVTRAELAVVLLRLKGL